MAIVGLVVAGIVGIVGPVVTALAAGRRQRRQLAHDRHLRDLDHSREILDTAVSEAEDLVGLMILVAVKLANEKSEEAGTMLSDALDSLAKFHANCRRLPLRRGWDDPLSAKLAAHQNVVSNLFSYLNDCRTDVEYDDDLANEKLAEIATTRDQLIEVAVPLLGTVDPS